MAKTILLAGVVLCMILPGSLVTQAQEDSRTEIEKLPGWTQTILGYLGNIEKKTVTIAEDFPEEHYNTYRPGDDPDVRTVAEILLHIAHSNARVTFRAGTEEQRQAYAEVHGGPPNVRDFGFTSKADTVAKVKETFAAVREAIRSNPDPDKTAAWLYAVVHSAEHFGNLVTYYRNLGLVPPTSRQ